MHQPSLPNLITIGAMKSATSSLHYYLGAHPEIHMSSRKELDFFVEDKNWSKGLDWYKSWFVTDKKIRGESSPNYTAYPFMDNVPEKMYSVVPDAKLIYIVRDPIERMLSHYIHSVSAGRENRPADDVFTDTSTIYYYRSMYFTQLTRYLQYYDKSRIMVFTTEELNNNRDIALARVFRFLEVDDAFRSKAFGDVRHKSSDKRPLTPAGKLLLKCYRSVRPLIPGPSRAKELLKSTRRLFSHGVDRPILSPRIRDTVVRSLTDDIARLRDYTGREFKEWSL